MLEEEVMKNLGLSAQEASIYTSALESGASLPKHLAERAGVKRPSLYKILPDLLEKGLLSETIKGKRRYFVAGDPELLLEKKRAELAQLEHMMPGLRSLLNTAVIKPIINVYEGIEGLKKIYLDSLNERKPILEFLTLEKIDAAIEEYTTRYYIPERIRRKIPIKILISCSAKYGKFNLTTDAKAYRQVKQVEQTKFPFLLDAYIYGNNISFLIYRTDSEPAGLIIRSREIATSMASLFNLAWEAQEPVKRIRDKS